jgi:hypothetical protein
MTDEDVADYLALHGLGTHAVDLWTGMMPAGPQTGLLVALSPGREGVRTHDASGVALERPRVQISARSASYPVARTLIHSAYTLLSLTTEAVINGRRYLDFMLLQSPFPLNQDDSGRHIWAFNVEVIKEGP